VGIAGLVEGKDEGDGECAFFGPPGVAPAAAAGDLIGCEDDGGGEEVAALAEKSGVVVGGAKAGEEVEAEGFDLFFQECEIEGITFHRCPMRSFQARRRIAPHVALDRLFQKLELWKGHPGNYQMSIRALDAVPQSSSFAERVFPYPF